MWCYITESVKVILLKRFTMPQRLIKMRCDMPRDVSRMLPMLYTIEYKEKHPYCAGCASGVLVH